MQQHNEQFKQDLISLLKASRDFADLGQHILADIVELCAIETVKGGQKIVSEGTFADHMFVVVTGRLRVSRQDQDGTTLLYNEVLPGECVGETAMLLQQPRTADIFALRDSTIALLSKAAFDQILTKYPVAINKSIVHGVYRHLRHETRLSEKKRAQSFLLLPLSPQLDIKVAASHLQQALSAKGKCLTVSDTQLLELKRDQHSASEFDQMEAKYDFILYLGHSQQPKLNQDLLHHSDQLIFIADGLAAPQLSALEQDLACCPGYQLIRKHLLLLYKQTTEYPASRLDWQQGRDVERVYPVRLNNQDDFARVGRFLTGTAVGLVLGGGGARGFAHIGVLKAFKQHNIPIDIIGGNSMGAVIGACYAIGIELEQIHRRILELNKNGLKFTLPMVSLMSSNNLKSAFLQGLGQVNIENLWQPFFAAACNLSKAETTILDSGPLWQAVMASNSPAGLFPPVVRNGELLVDGAILENVPIEAMRLRLGTALERRRGNGKVIAIDVDLKEQLLVSEHVQELNNVTKLKSWFAKEQTKVPGLIDILMQVAHIGGIAKGHQAKFAADLYLQPQLQHFGLMDYKKAELIIAAGYEYASAQIKEWSWHKQAQ